MAASPMKQLSFSELAGRRVALSVPQAVGLALAAANVLAAFRLGRPTAALPGDDHLRLDHIGQVTFTTVVTSTNDEAVQALARLLRRLLRLDVTDASREHVPGALMLLIARALGEIDLPALTLDEFRAAMGRFGSAEPMRLAGVYHRARPSSAMPHGWLRSVSRGSRGAVAALGGGLAAALFLVVLAGGGEGLKWAQGRPEAAAAPVPIQDAAAPAAPARRPQQVPEAPATERVPAPPAEAPQPAETLEPRLVVRAVSGRDVFSPSFSPEGEAIYFHAGRSGAALLRASFTPSGVRDIRTVVNDGASNYHVVVSPRADQIAYDSDRDGERGVYVANADGTSPRRISGGGFAAVPSWSPDGTRVAFVKAAPGRPRVWNVWIADVKSGALRAVTQHRVGQPWGASWFPDGRRLAYSLEEHLVILDTATGTRTVVQSPRRGHLVRTPAVSPDGTRVVFQVHRDGAWMLDVPGMRVRRILADRSAEEFVWSPDGSRIAYHASRNGRWGVWTMAGVS